MKYLVDWRTRRHESSLWPAGTPQEVLDLEPGEACLVESELGLVVVESEGAAQPSAPPAWVRKRPGVLAVVRIAQAAQSRVQAERVPSDMGDVVSVLTLTADGTLVHASCLLPVIGRGAFDELVAWLRRCA